MELATDVGKFAPDEATVTATTLRVKNKPGPKSVPDKRQGLELTSGDEQGRSAASATASPGAWTTAKSATPPAIRTPPPQPG